MSIRRPEWESYDKALQDAADAKAELERIQQENEDLKTLYNLDGAAAKENKSEIASSDYVNGIGRVVTPTDRTLQGYYGLVFNRDNKLDFWPEQSPAFANIIAQTFLDPAFSESSHPKYLDYEPLRDNLATLEIYLKNVVMHGVDTTNMDQLRDAQRKLEQMGRELGVALQRDTLFRRPGSARLSVIEASEPGVGAAKAYELLTKKYARSGNWSLLKKVFGYNYSDWKLPDIETTPFSKANVDAFSLARFTAPADNAVAVSNEPPIQPLVAPEVAPAEDITLSPPEIAPATQQDSLFSMAQELAILSAGFATTVYSLDRVNALAPPVKARSVELARHILENMRADLGDTNPDQWLEFPPETALLQDDALNAVARVYAEAYQAALVENPLLEHDVSMQQSNEALGKLAYLMKEQAGMKLVDEGRPDEAMVIMAELKQFPENWKRSEGESVETLLAQMQSGLEMSYQAILLSQQKGLIPDNAPSPLENLVKSIPQEALAATRRMHSEASIQTPIDPTMQLRKTFAQDANSAMPPPPDGSHRATIEQQKQQKRGAAPHSNF